jgi:MinD superfamily P-loop ATPase
VIASVTGTGKVLLVIEPSLSGLHDAKRLHQLVKSFKIPVVAVINKFDINEEITRKAENFLKENQIRLLGKIPYDTLLVESIVNKQTILEFAPENEISKTIKSIWQQLSEN